MTDLLNIIDFKEKEEFQSEFDRIAKEILHNYHLVTPVDSYIIREIEFYYFSKTHQDNSCHQNKRQLLNSRFYFHRFKDPSKYLNQKRKGIDITFGNNMENFGGILIRAIQSVKTHDVLLGIGNISNRIIFELGGPNKILDLYRIDNDVFDKTALLHLAKEDINEFKIFRKGRQGLLLDKNVVNKFFLNASYNYFTYPELTELL